MINDEVKLKLIEMISQGDVHEISAQRHLREVWFNSHYPHHIPSEELTITIVLSTKTLNKE
jgi:hypothetical protein